MITARRHEQGTGRSRWRQGVKGAAAVLLVGATTTPLFAAESWTLWRGMTTFTDVNARLPAEVQIAVETGLDRPSCETMKQKKLAELGQSSPRVPGSVWEDGFIRLEPGDAGMTKVLMRYLCVRDDARPGPAPWYYPGRIEPFRTSDDRETRPQSP